MQKKQKKKRFNVKKLATLFVFLFSSLSWTQNSISTEDLPPWLSPDLLVHISAMDMNENQSTEFRESLMECLSGLQQVVQREIRKGGVNIPKRIKRGINREYSKFDKRMKSSLDEPQVEHWEQYLEGLKEVMAKNSADK